MAHEKAVGNQKRKKLARQFDHVGLQFSTKSHWTRISADVNTLLFVKGRSSKPSVMSGAGIFVPSGGLQGDISSLCIRSHSQQGRSEQCKHNIENHSLVHSKPLREKTISPRAKERKNRVAQEANMPKRMQTLRSKRAAKNANPKKQTCSKECEHCIHQTERVQSRRNVVQATYRTRGNEYKSTQTD